MPDELSIRRAPTSGPGLGLGQLHFFFFQPNLFETLYHLPKAAFLPILHVPPRQNTVHSCAKNNNNGRMHGRKPQSLSRKREETLPKVSLPDYFGFVCAFINSQGNCPALMLTPGLPQDSPRGKTPFHLMDPGRGKPVGRTA